jgi:hypothetical protein
MDVCAAAGPSSSLLTQDRAMTAASPGRPQLPVRHPGRKPPLLQREHAVAVRVLVQ